jgi:hypothetical protein
MFENENTWFRASRAGKQEEFHSQYEEAVAKIQKEFGKRYPQYIRADTFYSAEDFSDTSPADGNVILGCSQKGTRQDAKKAVEAAEFAFPA